MFEELWNLWRDELPSEHTIINHLVVDRKLNNQAPFSEQSATELLGNYRVSLAFVRDQGHGMLSFPEKTEREIPTMPPDATTTAPPPTSASRQPAASSSSMTRATVTPSVYERVVFTEEDSPHQYIKVVISGEVNESLLEGLSNWVERQKRRLHHPTSD